MRCNNETNKFTTKIYYIYRRIIRKSQKIGLKDRLNDKKFTKYLHIFFLKAFTFMIGLKNVWIKLYTLHVQAILIIIVSSNIQS